MTNLKDLLNDFAEDIKKEVENKVFVDNWEKQKGEIIDELLKKIVERLIGY